MAQIQQSYRRRIFDSDRQPLILMQNEDDVKTAIVSFLEQYHLPYEILKLASLEDAGFADIALPKSRLVIETKSPEAPCGPELPSHRRENESQLDQLERYLKKLRELERQDLFSDLDLDTFDRSWVGVLTNGKSWWAWRWDDETGHRQEIPNLIGVAYNDLIDQALEKFATRNSGKSWIPDNPLDAFKEDRIELDRVYEQLRNVKSLPTQMEIWEQMIRGSGIPVAPESKVKIYLDHIFLMVICRFVISALGKGENDPNAVLGDSFGGWVGSRQIGQQWLQQMSAKVRSFNWTARKSDVFRNLYESLIEKADRKLFGEYYTPDWLAGLMIEDVLDENWLRTSIQAVYEESATVDGIGILDPCCGSGSFLYAAATRISAAIPSILGNIDVSDRADIVLRLVIGIDIHPLAVEMAQATLLRAINGQPTVEPQVYQGDSLLMERQWSDEELVGLTQVDALFQFPKGHGEMFFIPYEIAYQDDTMKRLRLLVDSAAEGKTMPKGVVLGLNGKQSDLLHDAHTILTQIIQDHGDGVWTWFIRNQLAPYVIHQRKINRIASNPPWLVFKELQDPTRKQEVEEKAKEIGVWPGGKLAASFDMAALFVVETQKLYLQNAESDKAAFVVNDAAVRAKTWERFRELTRMDSRPFLRQVVSIFHNITGGCNDNVKTKTVHRRIQRSCGIASTQPRPYANASLRRVGSFSESLVPMD